ncbi:hypothetical protein NC653_016441 [Populus alba x Populus x berolinensis]|uniref:Uncharacterized protein n=1 Tax=Populus alba x Populus x berolinensis TaxID=444605 RepID=A0AAD6VZQ7_9ROSI|nr:hypothetical protein NC653_016441 [Populus alba x Populus x berolinensis]
MFRTGVSPSTKTMNDADTRLALSALQVLTHFGRMLLRETISVELNSGFSLSLSSISAIHSGTIGIHYGHVLIHFKLYSFSYVCFTAGAAGIVFSGFYVLVKHYRPYTVLGFQLCDSRMTGPSLCLHCMNRLMFGD